MRRVVFFLYALVISAAALAYEEGDKVYTQRRAYVKVPDSAQISTIVPYGVELTVLDIHGKWLWVEYAGQKGWLDQRAVAYSKPNFTTGRYGRYRNYSYENNGCDRSREGEQYTYMEQPRPGELDFEPSFMYATCMWDEDSQSYAWHHSNYDPYSTYEPDMSFD